MSHVIKGLLEEDYLKCYYCSDTIVFDEFNPRPDKIWRNLVFCSQQCMDAKYGVDRDE